MVPVRIAVVDDHPVVRESLMFLLDGCADLRVVAEGSCGHDALALARDNGIDVLILDLDMPGQSGIDVLGSIHAHRPSLPVLVLSAHPEEAYAVTALRLGAKACLGKLCDPSEIAEAIRVLAAGRAYIPARIADLLVSKAQGARRTAHEALTRRELQVLVRMARGQGTRAMASELFLSPKTISACRTRVMRKLEVDSSSGITRYAVQHHLLN